jgi:hypothetical protein
MNMRNYTIAIVASVCGILGGGGMPVHAQTSSTPITANLRGTGTITLPGGDEHALNVLRLKMGSDHIVRLVAEGADVPPVEFSGKWTGPINKTFTLILTRALKGVKADASGRIYLRGPKDVERIALQGKAQGQDFSLQFLPAKPPVLAFKELSLTANGSGIIKMPDNTQSKIDQIALTLEKNGNATIKVNGQTDATFSGKWAHVGNSELIRLTITGGFNNVGGTGQGTLTMRSETEIENIYFTSKASEGVVYAVRFTGAPALPPEGTAAAPKAPATTTVSSDNSGKAPE